MKNISKLTLIVMLLSFNIITYAKEKIPKPPKGTNTIVIVTDSTDEANYKAFGRYLIEKGYSFDNTDKEFLLITTNGRRNGSYPYRFHVSFVGNKIQIRADVQTLAFGTNEPTWIEWKYDGVVGDIRIKAYRSFYQDLIDFNGEVSFEIH